MGCPDIWGTRHLSNSGENGPSNEKSADSVVPGPGRTPPWLTMKPVVAGKQTWIKMRENMFHYRIKTETKK